MKTVNIINLSGGKDSLATALVAKEQGAENCIHVFADTGHEHPLTYEYVDYLEEALGVEIKRVKADFSHRFAKKRNFVENNWSRKLMEETPGRWKLLKRYSKQPEPEPITDESRFEIGVQNGDWVWLSARRPMTIEQAQAVVDRALGALQPTGNPFLDLCILKGRFPSSKARFCTTELKHIPIAEQIYQPLFDDPEVEKVVSWQGVRAQESPARRDLPEREHVMEEHPKLHIYRPVHKWLHEDVFAIAKRHGIKPNPLYQQGMGRVGCLPCVNVNKAELREIFRRFPEEINRVQKWEQMVAAASKRGNSTFFCATHDPMNAESDNQLISLESHGIWSLERWANTSRGGKNFDALLGEPDLRVCSSVYAGVCE